MMQFAFDLSPWRSFGRADFFVSEANAAALGWIDRWPDWPHSVLVLHGDRGSGKTHLAHLWCERAGAALVAGEKLVDTQVQEMIERRQTNVIVDDADHAPEQALLHLFNACTEVRGTLLLTARRAPAEWPLALADLGSRIRAAPAVGIARPDEELLEAVLVKHFADRQLRIAPEVLAYLLSRMERSLDAAAAIAATLDQLALRRHRAVSIRMAREVLVQLAGQLASSDGDPGIE
jgi:chromosomal replication initiation ATPase DnaA